MSASNLPIGPVILDIAGLQLTQEDQEIIQHPMVGGVIFFKRNYESPEQILDVVKSIRTIRPELLLCVDQEGGRVQRFVNGLSRLPRIHALGDLVDSGVNMLPQAQTQSYRLGQLMALEMRALGMDLSFAPVLDLDRGISEVIGDRAFHRDPSIVSALAKSYIEGMNSVGMQAVGKHFPGHGAVALDSHHALPIDNRPMSEIEEDLSPFKDLIKQGMAGIMPAHIVYPKIDNLPVGFSKHWLQTILRQQCGFEGAIVSDDLSMEGASVIGSYPERAQCALEAGCDYLLVCNHRPEAVSVLDNTKYVSTDQNYRNRLKLLAKGRAPSWQDLKQSDIWLASSQVPLELEQKTA